MAIIYSYPTGTVQATDMVIGSDPTVVGNPTKNFRIGDISTFIKNDILGYNVYTALLTQTGVNPPVATVLKNDIGATITWTRTAPGEFTATASSAVFTAAKTIVFLNNGIGALNNISVRWSNPSTTTVFIDALQDGFLTNASIEIRIYS